MIDRSHDLPISQQARQLVSVVEASIISPRPVSCAALAIMRRVDELHMAYPFAESRMLRDLLCGDGVKVGRLHVAPLKKKMSIAAIYRRPNTSRPAPGHRIYPYLLRKLAVTRPNHARRRSS